MSLFSDIKKDIKKVVKDEILDTVKKKSEETIGSIKQAQQERKAKEQEILENYRKECEEAKKIIVSTGEIPGKAYDIVEICIGHCNNRMHRSCFDDAITMLRVDAMRKQCDAVVNVKLLLTDESREFDIPMSIKGAFKSGIKTGVKMFSNLSNIEDYEDMLDLPITKDAVISYGTGVKFVMFNETKNFTKEEETV